MKTFAVVAALFGACTACIGKPECGGELGGFFKNGGDPRNCSYVHISRTGEVFPSAAPFTGCSDRTGASEGIPVTAKNDDDHLIYFMTGSGTTIFSIAYGSGEQAVVAALPASYNWTIGLQYISGTGLYMLTTDTLFLVPAGKNVLVPIMEVAHLGLSDDGVMTAHSNHKTLFVTDGKALHKFDVSQTPPIVSTLKMNSLTKIMDLAVYVPDSDIVSLIALQNYKLYSLDMNTGASSFLLDIPDGPGFPRVNAIFTDTFYVCDFDNIFAIDLPSKIVLYNASFDGALLQGYFQFHN